MNQEPTTTGDISKLSSPRLVPVRELSSPLVDQSASRPVRELAIRELSSNHDGDVPHTTVPRRSSQQRSLFANRNRQRRVDDVEHELQLVYKATFHYASWLGAGRRQVRSQIRNSITLSGSNQRRTSFEPAPNQIA